RSDARSAPAQIATPRCDMMGRLGSDQLADAGIEQIGGLDGQMLVAHHVAEQVIGIPGLATIGRIYSGRIKGIAFAIYHFGDGFIPIDRRRSSCVFHYVFLTSGDPWPVPGQVLASPRWLPVHGIYGIVPYQPGRP